MTSLNDKLSAFVTTVSNCVAYCHGTVPLTEENCTLFYLHEGKSSFIDFRNASDKELQDLAEVCQPATFSLNQEDVLDESYRKAGKMDRSKFSIGFHPTDDNTLKTIQEFLVQSKEENQLFRAELYELNVYGPGSFFKHHVDTPRSDDMIGSLVVIFPSKHEGGSLNFEHLGQAWTFDPAKTVNPEDGPPQAAYFASYSDVQHEVTEVISGHRVTLTYNLFIENAKVVAQGNSTGFTPFDFVESQLDDVFKDVLQDRTFLPKGGVCAFGLSHKYPVQSRSGSELYSIVSDDDESNFLDCTVVLKGVDCAIKRVCETNGFTPQVNAYSPAEWGASRGCLTRVIPDVQDLTDADLMGVLTRNYGDRNYHGMVVIDETRDNAGMNFYNDPPIPIRWIKPFDSDVSIPKPFTVCSDNDASIEYNYVQLCLVIMLGPAGDRLANYGPSDYESE